jgi:hypothetical protein
LQLVGHLHRRGGIRRRWGWLRGKPLLPAPILRLRSGRGSRPVAMYGSIPRCWNSAMFAALKYPLSKAAAVRVPSSGGIDASVGCASA